MISILASRVGRDFVGVYYEPESKNFNPRVPGGTRPIKSGRLVVCQSISILASRVGRDDISNMDYEDFKISILASRVGRDTPSSWSMRTVPDFNPRVPGGTRLTLAASRLRDDLFQSSRPGWDATRCARVSAYCTSISILASRVGRDCW